MDVEKPLANSQFFIEMSWGISFSPQNLRPFFTINPPIPGQAPLLNESFALPSFTGTFALECPYLNRFIGWKTLHILASLYIWLSIP